jgi:hypothetical protein
MVILTATRAMASRKAARAWTFFRINRPRPWRHRQRRALPFIPGLQPPEVCANLFNLRLGGALSLSFQGCNPGIKKQKISIFLLLSQKFRLA